MRRRELPCAAGVLRGAQAVAIASRHSVVRDGALYQVFMFAEEEHAEIFRAEFGGERMHPSERGKGARWARWKKGPHQPTPERP